MSSTDCFIVFSPLLIGVGLIGLAFAAYELTGWWHHRHERRRLRQRMDRVVLTRIHPRLY